jgi:hypothetical protein
LPAEVVVNHNTPPPPGFSQVFILKVVKVICFDTLLQVLILKVDGADGDRGCQEQRQRITLPSRLRVKRRRVRRAVAEVPPPPAFGKRGGKLLKTKGTSRKREARENKRRQANEKA